MTQLTAAHRAAGDQTSPLAMATRRVTLPGDLLAWLARAEAEPLSVESVPGASPSERRQLAALGGLISALVADHVKDWDLDRKMMDWWAGAPQPPNHVVQALHSLIEEYGDAGLGQLYARLVAAPNRRRLGTFFTPPMEVGWMVTRWCATQPTPRAVIDIGAGVGIFTAAAAKQWPESQVWAVDVNPVTLGLLAARVAAQFSVVPARSQSPGIRLVLQDYVEWAPTVWPQLPDGRLVLGNPPYTRLQLLPHEDRVRLAEAAGGLCGGRASMSALMTAVSVRLLSPNDGLCLLLPAQWLESIYALGLRKALWNLDRRRVELRLFDAALFDDALVDAVALLIGTEREEPQPLVVVSGDSPGSIVDRSGDCPARWRALFVDNGPSSDRRSPTRSDWIRLHDIAIVRRGVATGANHFFTLSESERQQWQLPTSVVRPLARRLRDFPRTVDKRALDSLDDDVPRWLLTVRRHDRLWNVQVAPYLEHGKKIGADVPLLCQRRDEWYDLSADIFIPDVIVGPMTRRDFRLVENPAGAAVTNNLYGIRWRDSTSRRVRTSVVAWLRSAGGQRALASAARHQAAGLKKLEPAALRELLVPRLDGTAASEELNLIWD